MGIIKNTTLQVSMDELLSASSERFLVGWVQDILNNDEDIANEILGDDTVAGIRVENVGFDEVVDEWHVNIKVYYTIDPYMYA